MAEEPVQADPEKIAQALLVPKGYEAICKRMKIKPHPVLPIPTGEEMAKTIREKGLEFFVDLMQRRNEAIRLEGIDPLFHGFEPKQWADADALLSTRKDILINGANRCLSPSQIIYDPINKWIKPVSEIDGPFYTPAWDGKSLVAAPALKPVRKHQVPLVRVRLSNGAFFECSEDHQVLTFSGWRSAISLSPGDAIFSCSLPNKLSNFEQSSSFLLQTNSGLCLSVSQKDGGNLTRITEDSQGNYWTDHHQYDAQLLRGEEISPASFPLPADALAYTSFSSDNQACCYELFYFSDADVPAHTPFCNRPYRSLRRLSNSGDMPQILGRFCGEEDRFYKTKIEQFSSLYSSHVSQTTFSQSQVGLMEYFDNASSQPKQVYSNSSFAQTVTSIQSIGKDFCYDFTVPHLHNYYLGGAIHRNSGKSEYSAKRCVQKLYEKPGANVWCLSTSSESSIRDQQKLIYKYLPREWKRSKANRITRILYSQSRGFTDRVLVAPNGSEMRFMNYEQNRNVIEGGQIDLFWADELIPIDWLTTLRGRTVDRRGKGYVSFTPVTGFTPTVADYLNGAKAIASVDSDVEPDSVLWKGLPKGQVPYILKCMNDQYAVIYFQAKNNPYIPYDELLSTWNGKTTAERLIRLHGVTQKVADNAFVRFGQHNIVDPKDIPRGGTNYHLIDFAWDRNWAQIWIRVFGRGDNKVFYIYREWPDFQTYNEWVVASSKADGARGPAQTTLSWGINDYKGLWKALESEKVFMRYGDPRSGSTGQMREEGTVTIMQLLEEGDDPVDVMPVSNTENSHHILHGVNLVNEMLEFDMDKPMTDTNKPRIFVSSECKNFISCMKMWTGRDGQKGASKDFVDLLRYAVMSDIEEENENMPLSYGGGSY